MNNLEQQIGNKCRHFNGTQNPKCRAGVVYNEVKRKGEGGLPCFKDSLRAGKCKKCEWKTAEEIQARMDEITRSLRDTGKAIAAIVEHTGGKPSQTGNIKCPCCKNGRLAYSVASNGHIHAGCSTSSCVRFMQ